MKSHPHPWLQRAFVLAFVCTAFSAPLAGSLFSSSPPPVEVYFSPEGQLADRLIELIDKEPVDIRAAVYCLMHGEIAKALNRAKERGVRVEVIIDPYSVKYRSPVGRMESKGIAVHVWDPEEVIAPNSKYPRKPLMHDKFCVFGDHTVWTGSFNFTKQASFYNRENVVVLRDSAIAARYLQEFQKIKKEGCRPYRQFIALKAERKTLALK